MCFALIIAGHAIRGLMDSGLHYLPILLYLCLLHFLEYIRSCFAFVLIMYLEVSLMDSDLRYLQDLLGLCMLDSLECIQ